MVKLDSTAQSTVAAAAAPLPSLTAIIPVYNEVATIRAVLQAVKAVPVVTQVVVVDDCSTDGTAEALDAAAAGDPRLTVVHHPRNRGKGAAIVTGLRHATSEVVVIQDADLEYEPCQFADLLRVVHAERAPVVYGSRFRGTIEGMRFPNYLANRILTLAANLLFRARITDEATCYKMFRREVLRDIPLHAQRFDFCPEVTAKVLRRGYRIREVPIRYRARTVTEGKKIRWTDGVEALWALIKYRFVD
jgi:glycosyltransferase involved in cell wall biosynthesis